MVSKMAAKYRCFTRELLIMKQLISSKSVRAIGYRTVEDISSVRILQASMVWHDEMLHHEKYTEEFSAKFLPMINLDPSDPSCI